MSAPLRTCPFCGASGDDLHVIEIDTAQWAVTCNCCEAIGPSDSREGVAVEMWNGAAVNAIAPVSGGTLPTRPLQEASQ